MSTIRVSAALSAEPDRVGAAVLAVAEDQWFDRKSARVAPSGLAPVLVAFANADGGTVVVGLHDGGVEGTDASPARRNDLMQAAVDHTHPPVRVSSRLVGCRNDSGTEDHLLVMEVHPGSVVHATNRDEVYLRVGDENRRLSFDQRQELLYDKGQAAYETTPVPGVAVADLETGLLEEYGSKVGHPDPARLLVARGLAAGDGTLSAAAVLLFHPAPQSRFPEAYVRVLRHRGTERGSGARQQVVADHRCEGPVPLQLQEARLVVAELQPGRRALGSGGRFEHVGLVPADAWLEGIVNAVVHRSYSMAGDHTRIEIFDDRIEIESPGRFPGIAGGGDPLTATRFARNPRIARVCSDLDFGQELGEGIRRMFDEMRLAGLSDPLYRQTAGSVRLTLSSIPADRALEDALPPQSRELLRHLRQVGRASTGELMGLVGASRPVVVRRLRALEEAGLVDWVGNSAKDPRAYWQLRRT